MNLNAVEKEVDKLVGMTGKRYTDHPHFGTLRYYQHRIGLGVNRPTKEQFEWLNENTRGRYSVDYTCPPFNLSFELKDDAMLYKLVWGGLKPYVKY